MERSQFSCVLEASEFTRLRMEESLPNYHEDHIAGKGRQFNATLQFGTQIHSYASEKLEKIPAWDLTKVRRK